ncbi:formin-binding protein 4 [Copidosoma floridanum]|uniref:formin-binding protein 4 n=1 Tax=Copidosoma floridanum TaxID=29053 RepID=UPI0006C94800|nr:formin-binding protein 4 [Copidosoma floridanum]
MKRRQRKPVLNINGDSVADSHRRRWPNERQTQNGLPSNNPLTNLVGHYNSDSEAEEDNRPRARVLNDKVDDFFKEIQSISHDGLKNRNMSHPGSYWQECFDEQTGYPYYWHTETNQVTWEIPAELKALHEKNEKETPASPHASHIPQWPNAPPSKYPQSSQSNIPEGMIPKDVVVRNRNRQAGIVNKPAKSPKTDCFKVPFSKDDSFDDGKIEMITSFGNDESESEEESEQEEPQKQKSCLKKSLTKPGKSSSHSSESKEPRALMGPAPPPVAPLNYGPQNKEKLSDRLSQNVPRTKTQKKADIKDDDDILQRLKSQAKLLQTCENDEKSNSSREDRSHTPPKPPTSDLTDKSKKRIKLSLVPGYEDDSEGEDESSSSRKSAKPLFPISEQLPPTDSQSDGIAKKIDTNVGSLRVYDYRSTDSTQSEPKIENASTDSQSNVEEKPEEGLESKANKFLDSIDVPSKAFQRKKRIAFDVAPTKSKEPEAKEEPSSSGPVQVSSTDPSERRGFGFSKDENRNSPEAESGKTESDAVPASKKPGIAFVKSTEESTSGNNVSNGSDNGANSTSKPKESSEAEKTEVKQLTEPIMEKLRFLSEGSSPASAVQIMAIQIQTLMCAWEAGVLQEAYLRNWLVGTASELTRLEQTAAPPGWECQWDRYGILQQCFIKRSAHLPMYHRDSLRLVSVFT